MTKENPMWEARRKHKKVVALAKSINIPGRVSRISIRSIEAGVGKKRMAVVQVAGNRFDYFDPMSALRKHLAELADPSKQPCEVRTVDPAMVQASSDHQRSHSKAHYKSACKRMRATKGCGKWLRMWSAPRFRGGGWFFLFPDKVVHVNFSNAAGWRHTLVPEAGM